MMIGNSADIRKIRIVSVISEAVKLYKTNHTLLLKITSIAFLFRMLITIVNYINNTMTATSHIFNAFYQVLYVPILLILAFFSSILSVALYAGICERLHDRETNVKGTLSIASGKIWRYIFVELQLSLVLIVPTLVVFSSNIFIKNPIIKYMLISAFTLIVVFLYTLYGFAPLRAIFEKVKGKRFTMSKKMVKGDFFRTAVLMALIPGIFLMPGILFTQVFNDKTTMTPLIQLIVSSIGNVFQILIAPFTSSLRVVLYYKLRKKGS